MKKVGTQVELDLSSVLKEFDAAYAAVIHQGKAWQQWDAIVKRTFPTLKQAQAALQQTVGRLDELRHTQEGAGKAGREEINIRQAQVKSLWRVIEEYKKAEAARQSLAKTEAAAVAKENKIWEEAFAQRDALLKAEVQAAFKSGEDRIDALTKAERASASEIASTNDIVIESTKLTTDEVVKSHERRQWAAERGANKETAAAKKAEQAQERHTKSITAGLKKMLLWGAGAASAYRLFMTLRRGIEEAARELYSSTEEWKRAKAATDAFGKSLLLAMMPQEKFLDTLDRLADALDTVSGSLVRYGATQQAVSEIIDRARAGDEKAQATLMQYGRAIAYVHKTEEGQALIQDRVNELVGEYNALIEKSTEKTEDFSSAMDEWLKRTEDYNKALYQITERRFADTLDAQRDYNNSIVELELARQRTVEDNAIAAARRLEDIQLDTARRMAAIEREYAKQIESAKRDYAKETRRAAEDLAQKLLDIERKYQDRLLDIERTYAHSMYDAIATRDATAALQAMRQRREDLADAKRDRDRARSDAESDYARRIRDLRESLAEQERIARQSYQDQLEELRRSLAEQEEDYQISLRRREEDAELSYARSLEDLQKAFFDRLKAIQAQNTLERANAKADYLLRESAYAKHLARMAAIWQSYQTATTTPSTPAFNFPSPPPIPFVTGAKGGMMIVDRPTLAMFGEAGREMVIAQPMPLGPQTHNIVGSVTHQINATISQSIAGMEGRIAGAVQQALMDVIH